MPPKSETKAWKKDGAVPPNHKAAIKAALRSLQARLMKLMKK